LNFSCLCSGVVTGTKQIKKGKEIETLVNENLNAGSYNVDWNASQYLSGIYFYRIETESYTDTKRMMLIK